MTVVVFLGPTLPVDAARAELDAIYLPPAAQGDVYRVARERPFAIGIIDGAFESVPAVWHKEILWALARGIHVVGGASMGALRAAELARFGMQGVGRVYEAYASEVLEDDDEVAVAHLDASLGYRPTSEALVNVRATLEAAVREGVIPESAGKALIALGKRTFYPERTYPEILARWLQAGGDQAAADRLRAFLERNRVDRKREDAVLVLRELRRLRELGETAPERAFSMSHTEAWDQVVEWADAQPSLLRGANVSAELVAAEVRQAGERGRGVLSAAYERALAGVLARRASFRVSAETLALREREFRRARGLDSDEALARWLAASGLTREQYRALLERTAEQEWVSLVLQSEIDQHVLDELRLRGEYAEFAERAREKERILAARGLIDAVPERVGEEGSRVLAWYLEERLGCPLPAEDRLEGLIRRLGLPDRAALEREALREFLYSRLKGAEMAG
ncbi:MAG TPA: TfuA-like protein [Polyangiaceae bacterium]|nr:TfuA-like protein [Polyangiaceae bacterium]